MKAFQLTFLTGLLIVLMAMPVMAQIVSPAPSPAAMIKQTVGLTEVSIEYSRPSKRDRVIFGDLVPYDKIWRTGANGSTKFTFSDDVMLGGKEVPAGTYAIYTKPGKSSWTVMIYKDLRLGGGVANYDEAQELARFSLESNELPMSIESFTFMVGDLSSEGANIYLMWDQTAIAMPLKVNVDEQVMASIEQTLAGASSQDYYNAAMYYYSTDRDLKQAMTWMDKSLEMREGETPYWMMTNKARLQAKAGDKKGAMATSKMALAAAKAANNMDYVKINEDLMKSMK
jgi:hypothetical protein